MTHDLVIFDGVPASGKTTMVRSFRYSHGIKSYNYKRLGLVNIATEILMRIAPHLQMNEFICGDPVMGMDATFLRKISSMILSLEILYKFMQYSLIFLAIFTNKTVVVDEGPSLGWANYLNLLYNKNALGRNGVVLLMRLDLRFLWFISKFHKVQIYFIDRDQATLNIFWQFKGHKTPYDVRYANMVRYSFKLFAGMSPNCITIRYVYA